MPGLTVLVSLAGLGVSVYLTVVHYSAIPLVCTSSGAVNCERVLSSGYSVIAGSAMPTSAAGIVWFAVSAALAVGQLRGRGLPLLTLLLVAWSAFGLLTVLGLVFIEIVMLGTICLWCTAAHALVLATFLLAIAIWQAATESAGSMKARPIRK
jgi:uncharacterized membrane protein